MIAVLLLALAAPTRAEPALFDPVTGYRIAAYRGVVPGPPPGVRRIGDGGALSAFRKGRALFVDVTPAPGAVRDGVTGDWRLAEPHATIPGAHWFPEAGRGPPDAAIDPWFADGVRRLTRGSRRRPIVIFCLADCWMSWNGAWKLRRLGYADVTWYANGVDGWTEISQPLSPARPER